jgi:hypothetical protein
MRTDRSLAALDPRSALALVAAVALVLSPSATALAGEVVHGVEVVLPPSSAAARAASHAVHAVAEASPPAQADAEAPPRFLVVTPAPPPVRGWEKPAERAVEIVGVDPSQVVVYSPPPEPMPGPEKLEGVDIRTHRFAEAPEPSRITTVAWQPGARTQILTDDWRSADRRGVPTAGTGRALASQSWNPSGARYAPARIRYDDWPTRSAGGSD